MGVFKNLSGQKFGKLTVSETFVSKFKNSNAKKKRVFWECECECGNKKEVEAYLLTSGMTKSCGCILKSGLSANYRHGHTNSRMYTIYTSMLGRCNNPKNKSYPNYGGRGIAVCQEWQNDFVNFYNWAMANNYNDSLSIDRIENDSDYCPENCRWTNKEVQANNTRRNRFIEINGVLNTLAQWSRIIGMDYKLLHCQLSRGKTLEEILVKHNIAI